MRCGRSRTRPVRVNRLVLLASLSVSLFLVTGRALAQPTAPPSSSPAMTPEMNNDQRAALMSVVGLDLSSADIVAWCESGGAGAAVRPAYTAWRTQTGVDDIARRLDATALQKTRDGMTSVFATTRQRLSGMGQPSTVCPQLASMWTADSFNARKQYPLAFAPMPAASATARPASSPASGSGTAAAAPAAGTNSGASADRPATGAPTPPPRKPFDAQYYATTRRPTGTVYTPSQFYVLVQSWFGTPRDYKRAEAVRRTIGTLYLRGRVVQKRESFFLEDNDGTFTGRLSVSPSIDLSAFEGEEITVEGTIDELPTVLVFLRTTRVVRDPSGLTPSTLPAEAGRRRLAVTPERIIAAAGKGLAPADIHGLLYHAYGATGVNGYEYREEMRLLMKDGWVYFRDEIAPTDLDVAASRRLEPQQWGRWRTAAGGVEIQRQDDYGRPDGDWKKQEGRILPSWAPGSRLSGSYSAAAFYGSVFLGGTYSSTSYVFKPDGRYERIGYTRSSSAAMAANGPQEFSVSGSSTSSGSGTQSVAGGGQPGVFVGTQSKTDDGAKNRGTYRLDGMTIEFRSDAGEVTRTLCVPVRDDKTSVYLYGRTFSLPSPQK